MSAPVNALTVGSLYQVYFLVLLLCRSQDDHLKNMDGTSGSTPWPREQLKEISRASTASWRGSQLITCQASTLLGAFELLKRHFIFGMHNHHALSSLYTILLTTLYDIDIDTENSQGRGTTGQTVECVDIQSGHFFFFLNFLVHTWDVHLFSLDLRLKSKEGMYPRLNLGLKCGQSEWGIAKVTEFLPLVASFQCISMGLADKHQIYFNKNNFPVAVAQWLRRALAIEAMLPIRSLRLGVSSNST